MKSGSRHAPEDSVETVGLETIADPYRKITTDSFIEEAKSWIHECVNDHTACCELDEALQPRFTNFRVIDCHASRDANDHLAIVNAPPGCVYFALSYVWGSVAKPPYPLPQTIKDSITTVLLLGYNYLWVDRYCIDQQDAEDKREQIQQMGAIYAGAYVTIIAYAGHDPYTGLPGVSKDCIISSQMPLSDNELEIDLKKSVWLTRAWTFQEYHLSTRKLIFTNHGRIWECSSHYISPIKHSRVGDYLLLLTGFRFARSVENPMTWESTFNKWWFNMFRYSSRKLSYPSDALNAISGVLNLYATQEPSIKHIWGVPYFTIPAGDRRITFIDLGWHVSSAGKRREGFPTWSPLGWQDFDELHGGSFHVIHRSLDFDVEAELDGSFRHLGLITSDHQAMRSISQGSQSLRVTACSVQVDIESLVSASSAGCLHRISLPITKDERVWTRPSWDSKNLALETGTSVYCVFHSHTSVSGLILKSCGDHFERMGAFVYGGRRHSEIEQKLAAAFEKRIPDVNESSDANEGSLFARRTFLLR